MPNHGKCKNCWWWKPPTIDYTELSKVIDGTGKCYMQSTCNCLHYTTANSYCPDYWNRKKGDKEETLEEWITRMNIKQ